MDSTEFQNINIKISSRYKILVSEKESVIMEFLNYIIIYLFPVEINYFEILVLNLKMSKIF